MKFIALFVLASLSLNVLAFEKVISSSSQIKAVSGCYMVMEGRAANFGLGKYCYDVTKHIDQVVILTDPESRGAPVPGSRPLSRSFDKTSRTCLHGSIADNGLEERCEAAREMTARQIR